MKMSPSEKYVSLREEKECPEIQTYNSSFQDDCDIYSDSKELLASLKIPEMCQTCKKHCFVQKLQKQIFCRFLMSRLMISLINMYKLTPMSRSCY